jgi:hypothetical protein
LTGKEKTGHVNLEVLETTIRSSMLEIGGKLLKEIINADGGGYQGSAICCECGQAKKFIEYRTKSLQTVLAPIEAIKRAYYYCANCRRGLFPKDEYLDIVGTSFSPGLRRMMGLVGGYDSFERGRNLIYNLAGIPLTTKAIERTSETIGKEMIKTTEKNIQDLWAGKSIVVNTTTKPVMYIAADGTAVPTIKEWREAKLGCVFTQTGTTKDGQAIRDENSTTYCGGIETAETFGKRIYAEAVRRGVGGAQKVVVLGDGARWIWNLSQEHFYGAIEIVDFYHASEHLWGIAKLVYGEYSPKTGYWVNGRLADLEKGAIEAIVYSMKKLKSKSREIKEKILNETGYFETNKERMRYAKFRKMGLFIGSGVIEAGCKNVVGRRLKQSGMQWTVAGANAVMALRMCQLSGNWEQFWEKRKIPV